LAQALPPEVIAGLLEGLQAAQQGLRALLHGAGLAPEVHGQPAWPFGHRVAAEMLLVDAGLARRVLLSLLCVGLAVLVLGVSPFWRRARTPLWLAAAALLIAAPWPPAHLLLAPAVATSLHRSPSGFTAQGIVRGQAVYQQHCVRCHGADGRGEGPDAAQLAMWPPNLNGALLWKRLDGELFWRLRHGMQGQGGAQTMPGFAGQLGDRELWEVLDYLQARAAGRMLRDLGTWDRPVRVPDALVDCRHGGRRSLRSLAGQRLRIAVPSGAGPQGLPGDDPRLVTVLAHAVSGADTPECVAADAQLLPALALVLGVEAEAGGGAAGYQLIADRAGWLRARGQPGRTEWSEDDLVCRSTAAPRAAGLPVADGLDALIRRMDAEPVRLVRGGFPH